MSVIWHDLECGAYAEDLALWRSLADAARRPGARRRRRHRAGRARPRQARPPRDRARPRPRAARRARAPRRRAAARYRRRATRAISSSGGGSRCASCRCRRSSCSAAATGGSRSCAARAGIWTATALLAIAIAETLELYEVEDGVPGAATRHLRARRGRLLEPADRGPRRAASASCSSAAARPSRPAASASVEHNVIQLDRLTRARARGARRAQAGLRPAGQREHPRDGRLRRQRGGDAGCLSCASARCTRT